MLGYTNVYIFIQSVLRIETIQPMLRTETFVLHKVSWKTNIHQIIMCIICGVLRYSDINSRIQISTWRHAEHRILCELGGEFSPFGFTHNHGFSYRKLNNRPWTIQIPWQSTHQVLRICKVKPLIHDRERNSHYFHNNKHLIQN